MPKTVWTEDRWDELDAMEEMLKKLCGLEDGSNFMQKLQACIVTAKALTGSKRGLREMSFMDWLRQQAIYEHKSQK